MKIGFANENIEKLLSKFTHNRPKFYFSILPTDPKPDKKCSQRDFFGPSSFKKARFGSKIPNWESYTTTRINVIGLDRKDPKTASLLSQCNRMSGNC